MLPQPNPLPIAWVQRIFARFAAIYGAQKLSTTWGPPDGHPAIMAVWAEALSGTSPESIGGALSALIESGREWPPTLPEFREACRVAALARQAANPAVAALPAPRDEPVDPAVRNALRAAVSPQVDHLRWARRLKSEVAARSLVSGAQRDTRLAEILERNIAYPGAIADDGARRVIEAAAERLRAEQETA